MFKKRRKKIVLRKITFSIYSICKTKQFSNHKTFIPIIRLTIRFDKITQIRISMIISIWLCPALYSFQHYIFVSSSFFLLLVDFFFVLISLWFSRASQQASKQVDRYAAGSLICWHETIVYLFVYNLGAKLYNYVMRIQ